MNRVLLSTFLVLTIALANIQLASFDKTDHKSHHHPSSSAQHLEQS
jgi:hypothetical protein